MNDKRSNDLPSRTRPGRKPDPDVSALRALRKATRDYLLVCDAFLKALDQAAEGNPELTYLRTALAVATGKRGSSFSTAHSVAVMLDNLLGESGFPPEEEAT